MEKFKIIEEGVLTHTEMDKLKGGNVCYIPPQCKTYSCNIHGSSKNCATVYSMCGSNYVSCTGPKNSEKMSCQSNYVGPLGPGGLTANLTSL